MTQDRTETAPHAAAAMDRLNLPNQDELMPVAAPCTCHPDDNPPQPCAQRYALGDCRAAALKPLAEFGVRELARAAGISPSTALRVKRGETALDGKTLRAVMAVTGQCLCCDRPVATPAPEPAPADPVAEAARVYIASKALHGPKWVQLRDAGLPIISTWIDESGVGETINWPGLWSRCISEASDCTHLIAYRELGEILKGAWAEVGAALAHGRKVILCGDFTEFSIKHHPNVTIWASSDIRTALRAITEASHADD